MQLPPNEVFMGTLGKAGSPAGGTRTFVHANQANAPHTMATDLSKPDLSMPPFEMCKLTHERSGNICVELAIEEHRPLGRFQP